MWRKTRWKSGKKSFLFSWKRLWFICLFLCLECANFARSQDFCLHFNSSLSTQRLENSFYFLFSSACWKNRKKISQPTSRRLSHHRLHLVIVLFMVWSKKSISKMMNALIKEQTYFVPMFQQLQIAFILLPNGNEHASSLILKMHSRSPRFMIYVCGNAVKNWKKESKREEKSLRYKECRYELKI